MLSSTLISLALKVKKGSPTTFTPVALPLRANMVRKTLEVLEDGQAKFQPADHEADRACDGDVGIIDLAIAIAVHKVRAVTDEELDARPTQEQAVQHQPGKGLQIGGHDPLGYKGCQFYIETEQRRRHQIDPGGAIQSPASALFNKKGVELEIEEVEQVDQGGVGFHPDQAVAKSAFSEPSVVRFIPPSAENDGEVVQFTKGAGGSGLPVFQLEPELTFTINSPSLIVRPS